MRKLILQTQVSIDGFMGRADGQLDWATFSWDDALKDYVQALTASMDMILLGHTLAQGFIPYWASVAANPDDPQHAFGKTMTDTAKIVFSRTLSPEAFAAAAWPNTSLLPEATPEAIAALKANAGANIIVYGGTTFASALIRENLIDEYHLFVNPAAIGTGLPLFAGVQGSLKLQAVACKLFACGVAVLHYQKEA